MNTTQSRVSAFERHPVATTDTATSLCSSPFLAAGTVHPSLHPSPDPAGQPPLATSPCSFGHRRHRTIKTHASKCLQAPIRLVFFPSMWKHVWKHFASCLLAGVSREGEIILRLERLCFTCLEPVAALTPSWALGKSHLQANRTLPRERQMIENRAIVAPVALHFPILHPCRF